LHARPRDIASWADNAENITSCAVAQRVDLLLRKRVSSAVAKNYRTDNTAHSGVASVTAGNCCPINVFIVPLPSNVRLFSFHCSHFRRNVTILYLMAKENNVGYWVLAADTMRFTT
jgi:hypothetical protein